VTDPNDTGSSGLNQALSNIEQRKEPLNKLLDYRTRAGELAALAGDAVGRQDLNALDHVNNLVFELIDEILTEVAAMPLQRSSGQMISGPG